MKPSETTLEWFEEIGAKPVSCSYRERQIVRDVDQALLDRSFRIKKIPQEEMLGKSYTSDLIERFE